MATRADGRGAGPERAFCRPLPTSGTVRLSPDESRHLVRARRVRVGDEVVLFDGEGVSVRGRLASEGDREGRAAVDVAGPGPARIPRRDIAVAAAFPGAGRADDLVALLAEVGVSVLVPLATERAEVDPAEVLSRRRERFLRLTVEAAKVNGCARTMAILDPLSVADVAAAERAGQSSVSGSGHRAILLDTDPALPSLGEVLRSRPKPLLLVGPEGGFSDSEVALLTGAGVPAASVSGLALKTEVAAMAAASIALA